MSTSLSSNRFELTHQRSKLRLFPLLLLGLLSLATPLRAAEEKPAAKPITLFMIGDSTMADKPVIPANSERGWGQLLPLYFIAAVRIENHAQNGRSTKSFLAEGRWKTVLERLQPGDFVIVQFGHNDQKQDVARGTEAMGGYKANLERYVRETRERGAAPILATPVARRKFDADGKLEDTHRDYPKATRLVAEEQKVPLLDLTARTSELLARLGPDLSQKLFNTLLPGEHEKHPDGLTDNTHFNALGATRVCDLAVAEIAAQVPALAAHLRRAK